MEAPQKTVVGLLRVSTKDQADDDRAGLGRQREVINRTIKLNDLNCIRVYEISDVSGTNVRNASEIKEILQLVENGIVTGVVVADLDRLLRPDRFEDFGLLQVFQDSGAILFCGSSEIDLSTKDGFLTGGIRASIAGFELRLIKERMLGAKEEKRRKGQCPSSPITLPLGVSYNRKLEKFEYTPEIAKVVEAFRLIDEVGITNHCELERRTGIKHRTLHNILRNPTYIGIRRYDSKRGKEKYEGKNGRQSERKKVMRKPEDVIEVKIFDQPAVSRERFDRVQHILGGIRNGWQRVRQDNQTINLAVGVAHCGYCGDRLYCTSGKRKAGNRPGYYLCKRNHYLNKAKSGGCQMRSVPKKLLDETLRKFTAEQLANPQVVHAIVNHYFETQKANQISAFQKNPSELIAELEKKIKRWSDAYDKEAISLDEFCKRMNETQKQIAVVKNMTPTNVDVGNEALREKMIRQLILGANAFARLKDKKLQRQAICQLMSKVIFKDEQIVSFQLNRQFILNCTQDSKQAGKDSLPQPT